MRNEPVEPSDLRCVFVETPPACVVTSLAELLLGADLEEGASEGLKWNKPLLKCCFFLVQQLR